MKATGIIRKIDELGRIVIPKEIRRTLHIRETDSMEIFTDDDGAIILKNIHQWEIVLSLQRIMQNQWLE